MSSSNSRYEVYLVCNAKYHDTNFARLELLKLLAENPDINTRVSDSFADTKAIGEADLLITYTCDLRPTEAQQEALSQFVTNGGRWFALHATNALLGTGSLNRPATSLTRSGNRDSASLRYHFNNCRSTFSGFDGFGQDT